MTHDELPFWAIHLTQLTKLVLLLSNAKTCPLRLKNHNYASISDYGANLFVAFIQVEPHCALIISTNNQPHPVGTNFFENHAMKQVKGLPADSFSLAGYYDPLQVDLSCDG